jgi:hypothetical protein
MRRSVVWASSAQQDFFIPHHNYPAMVTNVEEDLAIRGDYNVHKFALLVYAWYVKYQDQAGQVLHVMREFKECRTDFGCIIVYVFGVVLTANMKITQFYPNVSLFPLDVVLPSIRISFAA